MYDSDEEAERTAHRRVRADLREDAHPDAVAASPSPPAPPPPPMRTPYVDEAALPDDDGTDSGELVRMTMKGSSSEDD